MNLNQKMEITKEVEIFLDDILKNENVENLESLSKDLMKLISFYGAKEKNAEKIKKIVDAMENKAIVQFIQEKSKEHLEILSKQLQKKISKMKLDKPALDCKIQLISTIPQVSCLEKSNEYIFFENFDQLKINLFIAVVSNKTMEINFFVYCGKLYLLGFDVMNYILNDFSVEKSITYSLFGFKLINYLTNTEKDSQTVKPQELNIEQLISDITIKFSQYKISVQYTEENNHAKVLELISSKKILSTNNEARLKQMLSQKK